MEVHSLPEQLDAFFHDYALSLDDSIIRDLIPYYELPCLFIESATSQTATSDTELYTILSRQLASFRDAGAFFFQRQLLNVRRMTSHLLLADVEWKLSAADHSPLGAVENTYILRMYKDLPVKICVVASLGENQSGPAVHVDGFKSNAQ